MLTQIFAITLKDLKILMRDKAGMITLFLMPLMFILVMSVALRFAFQVGGSDQPIEILVINEDTGTLSEEVLTEIDELEGVNLVREVDDLPLTRESAEALIVDGSYYVAIDIPANYSDAILAAAFDPNATPAEVLFIVDPTTGVQVLSPIRGTVEGFVQKNASYAQIPLRMESGLTEALAQLPPQAAPVVEAVGNEFVSGFTSGMQEDSNPGINFAQVTPAAYQITEYPDSVEQNVPGYTIFGVFFIVQVIATSMLSEKMNGTFRRLLVSPLSKAALLLGKMLPYYLVNIIQVAIMFGVGRLVFGMSLGHSLAGMVLVTLAVSAAATGLGMLVATLGKTPEQVGGISTILVLTLAAVGGMMVPTFIMPDFLQTISRISPHAWALSAYQDLIVRGLGASAVVSESLVLFGFAAIFFAFAIWRFRFQDI